MHGSTYRLQINASFPLDEATRLVPYLKQLGVGAVYLSPIFAAAPGSTHGYDVCDPNLINPEIGGQDAFNRLSDALKRAGIGCILDIVPNHMSADAAHNFWWWDVLRRGPASPFAGFFDIDWNPRRSGLRGKVLLPVLSTPYGDALANGEIRLERRGNERVVRYGEQIFPINLPLDKNLPDGNPQDNNRSTDSSPDKEELHNLLEGQFYRLSYWKTALHEANYRRFFDVSTLLGIRMESEEVFEATHGLLRRLVREGRVDGVRVDHVDGLRDPATYLSRLRKLLGEEKPGTSPSPPYIVVEKILQHDEPLPDWPVEGTTGYDFLSDLNELFIRRRGMETLRAAAERFQGAVADREEEVTCKRLVLSRIMRSELNQLADQLDRLSEADKRARDFTRDDLRTAIRETIAALPVYRTYGRAYGHKDVLTERDECLIQEAVAEAARRNPAMEPAVFDMLRDVLLSFGKGEGESDALPEIPRSGRLAFALRFQQTTGSAAAKGVEDTAFYRHPVLLSLYEVGAALQGGENGYPVPRFHARMQQRRKTFPLGMLATSTHDTKRGEDARARLNVLSHRPGSWRSALSTMTNQARRHAKPAAPGMVPDREMEHFLYQSLLGSWPLDHKGDPAPVDDEFYARVEDMWIKAARENKRRTDWVRPDEDYEAALSSFLDHLLRGGGFARFARVFFPVLRTCAREGMRFSLAQVACKCAAPGIPDVYQGSEFWDLSFVDPDNRRPVDFAARAAALDAMAAYIDPDVDPDVDSDKAPEGESSSRTPRHQYAAALLKSWPDGMVKQYVLARCLRWRQRHLPVFLEGSYEPLETSREARPEVIAFRRVLGDRELGVVIPLRSRPPAGKLIVPCTPEDCIYRNLFTGRSVTPRIRGDRASLDLAALFADFPVAWLWRETAKIPAEDDAK